MKFTTTVAFGLAIVASACALGCTSTESVSPTDEGSGGIKGVEPTAAVVGGLSTDGRIAQRNLDARIVGLEDALTRTGLFNFRVALIDALLTRTAFFGQYSDFDRALDVAQEAVSAAPNSTAASDLQARVLSAVHRFDEALTVLGEAQAESGVTETIKLARAKDLADIVERREQRSLQYPGYGTFTDLAAALAATGRFDDADVAYRQAIEHYRDVSPFAFAWVAFQRGVMWAEVAGWPERAVPLYQEALRRLPGYVVANVHLAELEWQMGATGQAISRLEGLVDATEDPEPAGLLAEIQGDTPEARRLLKLATDRYDGLLSNHRLAFIDHGSEFFAGPGGDAKRALDMAEENYANRATERALLVVIEAALAAGEQETSCEYSQLASATPISVPLAELLAHSCP